VLLSVGADLFTLSLPSDVEPIPPGMPLIHLDVDPWEIGKNHPASVAILGDPKSTLPELTTAVRGRMTSSGRSAAQRRLEIASDATRVARASLVSEARALATKTPTDPLALLHAIGEMLPTNAVVVAEATSSARGIQQLIRSDDPQSFFGLRGGGLGWGMAAAIGVKLALPDRPVVALLGDGGGLYTCQALWTAARYRIGVVFVILNNASYRILKQRLHAFGGHAAATDNYAELDLVDPEIDFVGLARAFGVAAERARTAAEAADLIARALGDKRPMLLDVELDRAFKPSAQ